MAFLVSATGIMPTEPLPDGSVVLDMEIDRRDWADLTNTAVETISRTLRYLEEKQLVECMSPYRFRIRDVERLAMLAGVEPPSPRGPVRAKAEYPHGFVQGTDPNGRMTAVNDLKRRATNFEAATGTFTAGSRGGHERNSRNVEKIRG